MKMKLFLAMAILAVVGSFAAEKQAKSEGCIRNPYCRGCCHQ